MDEEAVKKAVEEYLEAPDQYALMITGEWGCGKTHFVEHALKDHVESLDKPYSLIRVSAYGTRTPDDLYDAIALGIVRGRAVGSDGKNAVVGLLQDAKNHEADQEENGAGIRGQSEDARGAASRILHAARP